MKRTNINIANNYPCNAANPDYDRNRGLGDVIFDIVSW